MTLAKVSVLTELAGWWRKPSGTLLHITHYESTSGKHYPRESVYVRLYLANGEDQGSHSTPVDLVRKLLNDQQYEKVGEAHTPMPKRKTT